MGRLLNINGWQAIKIMLVFNKLCIKTRNIIIVYGYFFSHTIDILCEAPCLLAQPLKAWLTSYNATCRHRFTENVRIWLNNTCRLRLCTCMWQQSVKMIKVNMILTNDEQTTSVSASITTTATHTNSHDFLEEFAIELVMSVQGR